MNGLKYILFVKDISLNELSEALGISAQSINLWSNQRRSIPKQHLETLANYFKVDADLIEKELCLRDKIDIEMQLNSPKMKVDPNSMMVDIGSANLAMYHQLESLTHAHQSLLNSYKQEVALNEKNKELIASIHQLSGKIPSTYQPKEQNVMNKVFIGNFNDTVSTDMDKIIQYRVETKRLNEDSDKCKVKTSIIGRLSETWEEVLMHETLTLPLDYAVKSDGIYNLKEDGNEAGYKIIESDLRYKYWGRIEEMNKHVEALKASPFAEASDLFLIPREWLSLIHHIEKEFGEEYILEAKWDETV